MFHLFDYKLIYIQSVTIYIYTHRNIYIIICSPYFQGILYHPQRLHFPFWDAVTPEAFVAGPLPDTVAARGRALRGALRTVEGAEGRGHGGVALTAAGGGWVVWVWDDSTYIYIFIIIYYIMIYIYIYIYIIMIYTYIYIYCCKIPWIS